MTWLMMLSTPFSRHTYLHTCHIYIPSTCMHDTVSILFFHRAYCLLLRIFTLYHILVLAPKKAAEKKLEEEVNDEQTLALTRVHGNEAVMSGVLMAALSCVCRITIINVGFALLSYPLLIGDFFYRCRDYQGRTRGNIIIRKSLCRTRSSEKKLPMNTGMNVPAIKYYFFNVKVVK